MKEWVVRKPKEKMVITFHTSQHMPYHKTIIALHTFQPDILFIKSYNLQKNNQWLATKENRAMNFLL